MLCRAIPYEGDEPYIFLSYCHKDADKVYPLLEQMVCDGCRIWYDDGNHPGDDWVENIASHLNRSAVCLAMVSEASSKSHNCRSEITFAFENGKRLMAVMLEDFKMPIGMRMQLSAIHYLKLMDYPSGYGLLQKLYETENFATCRSAAGSLPMRKQNMIGQDEADLSLQTDLKVSLQALPLSSNDEETSDCAICAQEENTVLAPELDAADLDESPTMLPSQQQDMALVRPKTGKLYAMQSALTRIGRSEKRCDIALWDNPSISNCHAEIVQYDGKCYLRDAGSTNGTFIHGERMAEGDSVQLCNQDVFYLHEEAFVFLCGEDACQVIQKGSTMLLRSEKTRGVKMLLNPEIWLDRGHKWNDGTLDDGRISRSFRHAVIHCTAEQILLEDKNSTNGTFVNEKQLDANVPVSLKEGDRIRLGNTILFVESVKV